MRVAIVGATGQVGGVMRSILLEREFPVDPRYRLKRQPPSVRGNIKIVLPFLRHKNLHTLRYPFVLRLTISHLARTIFLNPHPCHD